MSLLTFLISMTVFPGLVMALDSLLSNFLLLITQYCRLAYKIKKCIFVSELCLKVKGIILW